MHRSCPLGHTCDACLWSMKIQEQTDTGSVRETEQCAVVALVRVADAGHKASYSTGAAVESLRNQMAQDSRAFVGALLRHSDDAG